MTDKIVGDGSRLEDRLSTINKTGMQIGCICNRLKKNLEHNYISHLLFVTILM